MDEAKSDLDWFDQRYVSGDEHPSGLRDAIAAAVNETNIRMGVYWAYDPNEFAKGIEPAVIAWLSVVSEGEIAAATLAIHANHKGTAESLPRCTSCRRDAVSALAASREVLIPKEPG